MEPNRTRRDNFTQLLRAEWIKFRSNRALLITMMVAALLIVVPGLLYTAASHTSCPGPAGVCPPAPVGPGDEAVNDRFCFMHQPLVGDGSITVRVTSLASLITYPTSSNGGQMVPGVVPWAKAGVIIKDTTAQGSAYAAMIVTGSRGVRMQYNFTEDIASRPDSLSGEFPRWLRLTRSGTTLRGTSRPMAHSGSRSEPSKWPGCRPRCKSGSSSHPRAT